MKISLFGSWHCTQLGIPSSSVVIEEADDSLKIRNGFNDAPIDWRYDLESFKHNKPSLISYGFGVIPKQSTRILKITGSIKTNSRANLSIVGFEKTLAVPNWNSNFFESVPFSLDMLFGKNGKEARFWNTNFPYRAVLLKNGIAVFTNLPHLMLALDTPDFNGTNQFNLTNDFIFLTNNLITFSNLTCLLMVPSEQPNQSPMLKLWLVNDSGVEVTNIEVVFTSLPDPLLNPSESGN